MCNSSANYWFSKLIPVPVRVEVPEEFLSKKLQTNDASPCWYPSYLGLLAKLIALSRNTLSEVVLLDKYLKSPRAISCWKQASSSSFW